jgi:hypothetical protein
MRYVVELELQSDLGNAVGEAVRNALSALGSVVNLRIAPMKSYTWNIQLNAPVRLNPPSDN